MAIDWLAKLRNLLQVLAFCLAIAAIQFAFAPDKPYEFPLLYSLAIGVSTWALIDFGRHLAPSAADTGWPAGAGGIVLPVAGIVGGYLLGTILADAWFGLSSWRQEQGRSHLRNSLLITLIASSVASYYFYSANKSHYLQRKMREARSHASEAQLMLLQSQLEPHMLFNTLANLRVLIGVDPPRAQQMLDHMIDYLRATLNASRATTHPLQSEFDRLRDYLELMTVRMGPRLVYSLDQPPELAQQSIPTLLLQPLVENSIGHGLEPKVEGGRIGISARRDGNRLVLEVRDSGVGLPPGTATTPTGFGLAQVRERLSTLYGPAATLDLAASADGGASCTIALPIEPR